MRTERHVHKGEFLYLENFYLAVFVCIVKALYQLEDTNNDHFQVLTARLVQSCRPRKHISTHFHQCAVMNAHKNAALPP